MIPEEIGKLMLGRLAAMESSREYPRNCEHRGEIVAMVDDPDLPPGLKLKQWRCRFWGMGVTWKVCGEKSKRFECNECAAGERRGK